MSVKPDDAFGSASRSAARENDRLIAWTDFDRRSRAGGVRTKELTHPVITLGEVNTVTVLALLENREEQPQTRRAKLASSLPPCGVWTTSGWNTTP